MDVFYLTKCLTHSTINQHQVCLIAKEMITRSPLLNALASRSQLHQPSTSTVLITSFDFSTKPSTARTEGIQQTERAKKNRDKFERFKKTRICEEFKTTGLCQFGRGCYHAHSLDELKSPIYFDRAEELAKQRNRPVQAADYLDAKVESILRKPKGVLGVLQDLEKSKGVKYLVVTPMMYSQDLLEHTRYVEKSSIEINVPILKRKWFLTETQVKALKEVVGPRYNPATDTFRLVKRYRKPYTEIFDKESVHDQSIRTLFEIISQVRAAFPEEYVHQENCYPIYDEETKVFFETWQLIREIKPKTTVQNFDLWAKTCLKEINENGKPINKIVDDKLTSFVFLKKMLEECDEFDLDEKQRIQMLQILSDFSQNTELAREHFETFLALKPRFTERQRDFVRKFFAQYVHQMLDSKLTEYNVFNIREFYLENQVTPSLELEFSRITVAGIIEETKVSPEEAANEETELKPSDVISVETETSGLGKNAEEGAQQLQVDKQGKL